MSDNIVYLSDESFEADVLQAEGPVLVDYWAEWCGPCKMIAPILEEIATILINNLEGNLEVQGHTDTDGSEEINLSLSQSRADTVRDFLISEGVGPERVTAVGFGETRLKVDPEETAEDRAKNRRIEFRVN